MRPLQGVGKDVVFRDGTFADKMENFLIEYGGLDAETGISEQIEVSDAEAFDLRFTGNGSILRPESAFRRKYNVEYEKEGRRIARFRCSGYNCEDKAKQGIRKDIRDYYSKMPSVWSGLTTNIEVDHKNGRKDDLRLNDLSQQSYDDFQPLTKAENDYKRQKCKECKRTDIRPSGKDDDCPFNFLGIDYTEGTSQYDNCTKCRGCWLYDIAKFKNDALTLRIKKNENGGTEK